MYGLLHWTRSFTYDKNGGLVRNAVTKQPVFTAHPQPNNWLLIEANAKEYAKRFDIIQYPPAAKGPGEGYSFTELTNYESNWGQTQQLIASIDSVHEAKMLACADFASRQMSGGEKGVGYWDYDGRPGATIPSWFQCFNQPGEHIPPMVKKDDVPNPTGNYAFGRVRSLQNSIPGGAVEADTKRGLASIVGLGFDRYREDDGKGQHAPAVLRIMKSQPKHPGYVEYDSGNVDELVWYVNDVMQGYCAAADYAQYWNTQRACNQYDARQFDVNGGGLWSRLPSKSINFVCNPDVATTWSDTGGISQQIAFNLMTAYARDMFLPCETFMVYAEDYFPASPDFPTGRGFNTYLDNLLWIGRKFAFGNFQRRWVDKDVYCFTRDGNGGALGWSGGLLVATNFNTEVDRIIDVQTPWKEGQWIHNYSSHGGDTSVGRGGMARIVVPRNTFSNGRGYCHYAPGGVS